MTKAAHKSCLFGLTVPKGLSHGRGSKAAGTCESSHPESQAGGKRSNWRWWEAFEISSLSPVTSPSNRVMPPNPFQRTQLGTKNLNMQDLQ